MLLFRFLLMNILDDFLAYWQKHFPFTEGTAVIAACSGGIDSLALLDMLERTKEKLHIAVCAAHFEHGIRGEAAKADAAFVADFCRSRQMECFVESCDVPGEAERAGESLETAARRLRYDFLRRVAGALKAKHGYGEVYIATAHHGDDQAETVLMHLLRGTGINGLGGIRPFQGDIIRPLLFARKAALAEYCRTRGLQPRHDSTNDVADCLRNKIRLELLPLLEKEYNPHLTENLCQTAELAAADEAYLQQAAASIWSKVVQQAKADKTGVKNEPEGKINQGYKCSCREFLQQPLAMQRRLIQNMCRSLTGEVLPFVQAEAVRELAAASRTGSRLDLSFSLQAKISYEYIYINKKTISFSENNGTMDNAGLDGQGELILQVPGRIDLPDGRIIEAALADNIPPEADGKGCIYGDAAKCLFPLVIRHRYAGDKAVFSFGSKKLKKLLIDMKIPEKERDKLWLVTAGGSILWLAGYRRFHAAMADKDTKQYFILRFI